MDSYFPRVFSLIGLMIAILAVFAMIAMAEGPYGEGPVTPDVEVNFQQGNNRTETAYVGLGGIELQVKYNENATDWEVMVEHPLFVAWPGGLTGETAMAGSGHHIMLDFNDGAPPGEYVITVHVGYTDDNGSRKDHKFNLSLTYVRAWELLDFQLTAGDRLSVTVETFLPFERITVEFDTDGSLVADPIWQNMTDVEPGVHTFETRVLRIGPGDPRYSGDGVEDKVGYDMRGWIDGTDLQLCEKNVDPGEIKILGSGEMSPFLYLAIPVILCAFAIIAVFLWYKNKSDRVS